MNMFLLIAAGLTVLLGLAHSLIGEKLVFSLMRKNRKTLLPKDNQLPLRHQRIIWASWHLISVFGFGFAAILFCLARAKTESLDMVIIQIIIAISMFIGFALVLGGTKGKHPGWIVLLIISILVWLG